MTKKEIIDLIHFLENNGVLGEYLCNLISSYSESDSESDIKFEFLPIMNAFVWENTPEGHNFWKNLNDYFYHPEEVSK